MRFYLPEIGERIKLTADWSFSVMEERRNTSFLKKLGHDVKDYPTNYGKQPRTFPCTLPAGTVLTVQRIYIRSGVSGYSSITFSATTGKIKGRFWVSLTDANRIEFEPPEVKEQAWWVGVKDRLLAGEMITVYPPGNKKAGIILLPRGSLTDEELRAKPALVVAAGVKCRLVERGPHGYSPFVDFKEQIVGYPASISEALGALGGD